MAQAPSQCAQRRQQEHHHPLSLTSCVLLHSSTFVIAPLHHFQASTLYTPCQRNPQPAHCNIPSSILYIGKTPLRKAVRAPSAASNINHSAPWKILSTMPKPPSPTPPPRSRSPEPRIITFRKMLSPHPLLPALAPQLTHPADHYLRLHLHRKVHHAMTSIQTDLQTAMSQPGPPSPELMKKISKRYLFLSMLLGFLEPVVSVEGSTKILRAVERALEGKGEGGEEMGVVWLGKDVEVEGLLAEEVEEGLVEPWATTAHG